MGIDPQLIDPENGDYRVAPGSAAEGYGCQIFPEVQNHSRNENSIYQRNFSKKKSRSSIEVSGTISEDTFWNADTVKVVGNVEVAAGAILTIPAGVKVEFQDFYSLNIQGSIQALGEADNKIHFTSAHPDFFMIDYSTFGAWNGIRFHNTSYADEPSILQYCFFEHAKNVETNGVGAAISCFDFSKLKIENCLFQNNAADFGGAIGLQFNSNPQIINNIFTENYAFLGGSPLYCTDSYPKLISNTIVENQVLNDDVFFNTGVIHTFQAKPLIINNIVWDNSGHFLNDNPLLFCKWFYTEFNDINFDHPGAGNINADPLFEAVYPYSLSSDSPCIEMGTNEIPFDIELPDFDFLGNSRIIGNQIDMGALEWQNTGYSNNQLPMTNDQLTNYPNPFNPSTTISFSFTTELTENTELEIYNLKGQKVKTLPFPSRSLGMSETISVIWHGDDENGKQVSAGIYVIKLKTADFELSRKCLLLK